MRVSPFLKTLESANYGERMRLAAEHAHEDLVNELLALPVEEGYHGHIAAMVMAQKLKMKLDVFFQAMVSFPTCIPVVRLATAGFIRVATPAQVAEKLVSEEISPAARKCLVKAYTKLKKSKDGDAEILAALATVEGKESALDKLVPHLDTAIMKENIAQMLKRDDARWASMVTSHGDLVMECFEERFKSTEKGSYMKVWNSLNSHFSNGVLAKFALAPSRMERFLSLMETYSTDGCPSIFRKVSEGLFRKFPERMLKIMEKFPKLKESLPWWKKRNLNKFNDDQLKVFMASLKEVRLLDWLKKAPKERWGVLFDGAVPKGATVEILDSVIHQVHHVDRATPENEADRFILDRLFQWLEINEVKTLSYNLYQLIMYLPESQREAQAIKLLPVLAKIGRKQLDTTYAQTILKAAGQSAYSFVQDLLANQDIREEARWELMAYCDLSQESNYKELRKAFTRKSEEERMAAYPSLLNGSVLTGSSELITETLAFISKRLSTEPGNVYQEAMSCDLLERLPSKLKMTQAVYIEVLVDRALNLVPKGINMIHNWLEFTKRLLLATAKQADAPLCNFALAIQLRIQQHSEGFNSMTGFVPKLPNVAEKLGTNRENQWVTGIIDAANAVIDAGASREGWFGRMAHSIGIGRTATSHALTIASIAESLGHRFVKSDTLVEEINKGQQRWLNSDLYRSRVATLIGSIVSYLGVSLFDTEHAEVLSFVRDHPNSEYRINLCRGFTTLAEQKPKKVLSSAPMMDEILALLHTKQGSHASSAIFALADSLDAKALRAQMQLAEAIKYIYSQSQRWKSSFSSFKSRARILLWNARLLPRDTLARSWLLENNNHPTPLKYAWGHNQALLDQKFAKDVSNLTLKDSTFLWRMLPRQCKVVEKGLSKLATQKGSGLNTRVRCVDQLSLLPTTTTNSLRTNVDQIITAYKMEQSSVENALASVTEIPIAPLQDIGIAGLGHVNDSENALEALTIPGLLHSEQSKMVTQALPRVLSVVSVEQGRKALEEILQLLRPRQPKTSISSLDKIQNPPPPTLKVSMQILALKQLGRFIGYEGHRKILSAQWKYARHSSARLAMVHSALQLLKMGDSIGWQFLTDATDIAMNNPDQEDLVKALTKCHRDIKSQDFFQYFSSVVTKIYSDRKWQLIVADQLKCWTRKSPEVDEIIVKMAIDGLIDILRNPAPEEDDTDVDEEQGSDETEDHQDDKEDVGDLRQESSTDPAPYKPNVNEQEEIADRLTILFCELSRSESSEAQKELVKGVTEICSTIKSIFQAGEGIKPSSEEWEKRTKIYDMIEQIISNIPTRTLPSDLEDSFTAALLDCSPSSSSITTQVFGRQVDVKMDRLNGEDGPVNDLVTCLQSQITVLVSFSLHDYESDLLNIIEIGHHKYLPDIIRALLAQSNVQLHALAIRLLSQIIESIFHSYKDEKKKWIFDVMDEAASHPSQFVVDAVSLLPLSAFR